MSRSSAPRGLRSFPTRRSSDLEPGEADRVVAARGVAVDVEDLDGVVHLGGVAGAGMEAVDRKSTRLNSSHGYISYAVFCLKKKTLTRHCRQQAAIESPGW